MSVGNDELRIVGSCAMGELGPSESQPVFFHWRWYYHVPTWPLWTLILLLLVVPKPNRNRQAWLILLPLGLVLLVWRMPFTLLGAPASITETFGFFVVTGTMAWSAVWLLGQWLSTRYRIFTFLLLAAVMLAFGLFSYACQFEDTRQWARLSFYYVLWVLIPLLAMMLSGYHCRRIYSSRRFLLRLLVWIGVFPLGLLLVFAAIALAMGGGPPLAVLVPISMMWLLLAGILYLVNLPFLILAFNSPFYRERFERVFRVAKAAGSADGNPFQPSPSGIEKMRL